jgi:hypothetical protein
MRIIAGLLLAALLAACSTLNMTTANSLRSLDYMRDDIASLLIAFDVPRGIGPVRGASTLSFDVVVAGQGERHIKAVLEQADADEVEGSLPPPGTGRAYYLFGFADKDKAAIREAQAWARTLPGGLTGNSVGIALSPRLCTSGGVDPSSARVSVLIALPGQGGLAPLIDRARLSDLLAQSGGGALPPCADAD